jgi:hypothetical protein
MKKEEKKEKKEKRRPISKIGRRWILTLYPEFMTEYFILAHDHYIFDRIQFEALLIAKEEIRHTLYCIEKGIDKEHLHIHLYIELFAPQRMSFFKRFLGMQTHAEPCNGSYDDVRDYLYHIGTFVEKEGELIETGYTGERACSGVHDGSLSDKAYALLLEGYSVKDILLELGGSCISILRNLTLAHAILAGHANDYNQQAITNIVKEGKP